MWAARWPHNEAASKACWASHSACHLASQVALVPGDAMAHRLQVGAGCLLLSSDLLVDDSLVEPQVEALEALARGCARHMFGCLIMPQGPEDGWLVEGLAGWLEGQVICAAYQLWQCYQQGPASLQALRGLRGQAVYEWWLPIASMHAPALQALKAVLGQNELAYRRWRKRQAVIAADDGISMPPLSQRAKRGVSGTTRGWGMMYGTEVSVENAVRGQPPLHEPCSLGCG